MHWISLAIVSMAGAIVGFVIGKYSVKPKKKLELEKKKKEELNEVLFFPDMKTYAGDSNLSRQIKGQLYKEILDHSEPLLRLVEHISSAQVSLDLCLYILTCHKLTEAVISRMREADVRVRLIVHEAKVSGSMVSELQRLGAFVRSVNSDYLMHHKFCIVDCEKVLSGSFNWTMQAAMGNHENVIITNNSELVHSFNKEFEKIWQNMKE